MIIRLIYDALHEINASAAATQLLKYIPRSISRCQCWRKYRCNSLGQRGWMGDLPTCSLGPAGAAVQFPAAEASPCPSPGGHVRNILPAFIVTRVGARLLIRSGSELLRVYPSRAGIPRGETGRRGDEGNTRLLQALPVKCPITASEGASVWAVFQTCHGSALWLYGGFSSFCHHHGCETLKYYEATVTVQNC